jgi:ornithine cyclodeaminase
MKVLIVNHNEVREILTMPACIEVLEQVFLTLHAGDVTQPLRRPTWMPDRSGLLGIMPGFVGGDIQMMGLKAVTVMPGNHGTDYDSHQGVVMIFEKEHGVLKAIIDASEITAIRTAGASAVATKLLARPDAGDLAILGTGVQARSHLDAMNTVRSLRRVRVFSRDLGNREQFVTWAKDRFGLDVEMAASAQEAVAGADLICTTTSSREPVIKGEWLAPGCHVNAVGSSVAVARELDSQAMQRAELFVDWRESTLNESGDYMIPAQEGLIDAAHIRAELGELLTGAPGRSSAEAITVFDSLGLAAEDIACGHYIFEQARSRDLGQWVEIGSKVGFTN